jgi:hypothetical protein
MVSTGLTSSPLRWIFGIAALVTALLFSQLLPLWLAVVLTLALAGVHVSQVAEKLTKECGSIHNSINSISEAVIATAEAADEACNIADRL